MLRFNSEEQSYLNLMKEIIESGYDKPNRTGIPSRSVTGAKLTFTLLDDSGNMVIPLLTTKKTSFKLILSELLWFLSGSGDSTVLAAAGNHIWDANGSREFLDSRGFKDREVGDLGPVYGVQWRNWNKKGIDQIALVVNGLKADPWGRRHIVSAWNPEQIDEMALPPCHYSFQFIVRPQHNVKWYRNKLKEDLCGGDGAEYPPNQTPYWLDCIVNQRSADIPLGVPFNIASYSILTHMIASLVGLHAGRLVHNMGDAHIYHNQFDGCETQLSRRPTAFPTIMFKRVVNSIDDFKIDDIELIGYNPQSVIKFPFAV